MMNFRTIRDAIIDTLGAGASGKFRVIGYQKEAESAGQNLDILRSVQVFYQSGEFPKSAGSLSGSVMHNPMTFALELTVAKAASCDLSVLTNPASTPAQYRAALAAMQEASDLVDKSCDEMIEDIYQVIMDARNQDFGLSFNVADRWIEDIRKDRPIPRGEYAVVSGSMDLTCSIDEQVLGDNGTTADDLDLEIEIDGDDVGKAGLKFDPTT